VGRSRGSGSAWWAERLGKAPGRQGVPVAAYIDIGHRGKIDSTRHSRPYPVSGALLRLVGKRFKKIRRCWLRWGRAGRPV